jgi:uncharacterized protein (DUF433 family)
MELDLELTDEEVEYLILKYIRDQTLMGRTEIPVSEIYEYLEAEIPEDEDYPEGFAVLTNDALQYIADYEEKYRKKLN